MAKKKILDFSRVGKSVNSSSLKTVGKLFAGGIIGEALPSVFQRVTGVQSSGVAGNAISGVATSVLFLAMNQKEMAAGVVATKLIKATIAYGNPVVARVTGVPLALPSTKDGYTMTKPNTANAAAQNLLGNENLGDDAPAGVELIRLPNKQVIATRPREESQVIDYDKAAPAQLSEYLSAADLASLSDNTASNAMYGNDPMSMLNDNMPELFMTDGF